MTGTTCYLNSLLQCLFHLKHFRRSVFENNSDRELVKELRLLFMRMQKAQRPLDTRALTKAFGWNWEDLVAQQDVQELLRLLLEALDGSSLSLFRTVLDVCFSVEAHDYESRIKEDVYDLSVGVDGFRTVRDAIEDFFAPVNLVGDLQYQLPSGEKCEAVKTVKVSETPSILSIHLRRFLASNGVAEKLTSEIEFDEKLEFAGEVYELASVISHMGTASSGHYRAFCLVDGHWTNFDDENVRRCGKHEVFQENFGGDGFSAYLLFYAKNNNIPDPKIPKDLDEIDEKRLNELTVEFLSSCDFHEEKKLSCPRFLDSESYVEKLAAAANIPSSRLVVRSLNDNGIIGDIIEFPIPLEDNRVFLTDSSDIPVFVGLWIPHYEINWKLVHVKLGATIIELCERVCSMIGIETVPLNCYEYISSKKCGDIIEGSNKILHNLRVLCELPSTCQTEQFLPEQLPRYPSHLTLLSDEIRISTIPGFMSYMKQIVDIQFVSSDDTERFWLSLAKDLTYDQVIRCISRHLSVDEHYILMLLPETSPGNALRPVMKDVYQSLRTIAKTRTKIFYEICDEDVRFTRRLDITVTNPSFVSRFPIYLPRGACTLSSLRVSLVNRLKTESFIIYYVSDGIPTSILTSPDEELSPFKRIFCQLGIDGDTFIPVVYCDTLLLTCSSTDDLPYLLKIQTPLTFSQLRLSFSAVDQSHLTIVRKTDWKLEEIHHGDTTTITGAEGEMVAITHTIPIHTKSMSIKRS